MNCDAAQSLDFTFIRNFCSPGGGKLGQVFPQITSESDPPATVWRPLSLSGMEKNHVSGPAVLETETAEAEFVSQPETPSLEHSVNATSGSLWVPEDFSGVPKVNELHPLEASCFDWKLINVILLGVGFMLNMGAVITTAMAQVL